ncbi:hypothetical protein [Testudinibacter aquarius]|uniref:Group 4 capsule polysaccharide lipoprotein GfcB/YjbF n=1 Tax=Testudinibacter aquarius TaxID=1524974 RepID=A0A4R3Y1J3_9PAST|nr:hypothetical protein [Testudinibacter aquarius]KAE9530387.1 hypothetical protein A1D24_05975 [Testudinibacter aquarius]TCV85985.1 hypothetical protein EDC16_10753 [Testudinibacter aquarius]TNG91526.1 hypothetical protein FHQ21_07325 [Testudinibacter aquarius]
MFKKSWVFPLLSSVFVLSACNDVKDANKENFSKAIQEALDTQKVVCITLPTANVQPADDSALKIGDVVLLDRGIQSGAEIQQADFLESLEFFTKENKMLALKRMWGEPTEEKVVVYSETDKIKPYLVEESNAFSSSRKLCSGRAVVEQIVNFTEPGEQGGVKASQVNYRITIKDLADWATSPTFEQIYPRAKLTESELNKTSILILTNEGWKVNL